MNRIVPAAVAAGLLALALPAGATAPALGATIGGHAASATATPVRVALYEPTVPIPASPQAELNLAYTLATSSTGRTAGRASWLWPGDSVGTGFKTFGEQLGLPEQVYEGGYPFQVNAQQPGGEPAQADEPFPGTSMRATAAEQRAAARAGLASDGRPASGEEPADGGGEPPAPEAPDPLGQLSAALSSGQSRGSVAVAEEEPPPSGLPPELAALVDAGGLTSASTVTTDGSVAAVARSGATDVVLLGGMLRVESVTSTVRTTSDADRATATGRSVVGGLTVAGNAFEVGPDGVTAAGEPAPVPGLPDDPAKTLEALGLAVSLPPVDREVDGRAAEAAAGGLQVVVDVERLRAQLGAVPVDDIVGAIPNETGELKKVLQAAAYLAPRLVITVGSAASDSETVDGIELPDIDLGDLPAAGAGGDSPTPTPGSGSGGSVPAAPPPATGGTGTAGEAPSAGPAAADGTLDDAQLSAGLPELGSIPGALFYGGLALALAVGAVMRRLGLLVLGGGAACAHGLQTGLPDLRKARP